MNDILIYLAASSLFSTTFIITYGLVEYHHYLRTYHTTQVREKEQAKGKINENLKSLKKLLELTSLRIQTAQGDVKRIQAILNSLHQLKLKQKLTEFQKVFYYQFSPPSWITRFGEVPFDAKKIPPENITLRNSDFSLEQKNIRGRFLILSDVSTLQGILEIHMDFSGFTELLGTYATIDFKPAPPLKDFKAFPAEAKLFFIYEKTSDTFWEYTFKKKNQYLIFTLYTFFSIILISLFLYFLNLRLQKGYKKILTNLKENLSETKKERDHLKKEALNYQRDIQIHQDSCQVYKKFSISLNKRQEEQASYIVRSLDVLEQSLGNPLVHLSEADQAEIINSCLEAAKSISGAFWLQKKNVPIKAMEILDEIQGFFSEKICKDYIALKITCADTLIFTGDPIFTKVILLNIIGKAVYRVPQYGEVLISFSKTSTAAQVEVGDNGYLLAGASEKLIKKSFDFFISDARFNQICNDNNLIYEVLKDKNNFNLTKVVFPLAHSKDRHENVIKLFK